MIVSGQLLAFTSNAIIARVGGESGGVWRWMLVIATVPAVVLWFGMLVMPESPRWLASKARFTEALHVLKQVRSRQRAEAELAEVSALAVKEERQKLGGWRDMKATPWIRKLMFVGFGIAIVQQITGVNTIMYYGTQILTDAGFTSDSALTANIANGVISVLATFVGIWLLGRVNRRPMLMVSQLGTTVALLLIGVFSLVLPSGDARAYAVLASGRPLLEADDRDHLRPRMSAHEQRVQRPPRARSRERGSVLALAGGTAPGVRARSIAVNLEAHPDDFCEENTPAVDLVRAINKPWVNYPYCAPHSFHLSGASEVGADIAAMMRYAGDKLRHVHIADSFNHKGSSGLRYILNPPGTPARIHHHLDIGQGEVD